MESVLIMIFAIGLFFILPLVVIIGVIYIIIKSINKNKTIQYSNDDFITRLKEYKSKGYKSINEIIEYEESDEEIVKEKVETPKTRVVNSETKITSSENNKSYANITLYLGSFLVTFAMIALVTLGWNTLDDGIKVFMLLTNLLGFLISGFLFIKDTKLRRVGVTFLTVSSIGYFLLTLGIWNFILIKHIPDYFNIYWLITSISGLVLNLVIMNVLKERRFFYLLLFSIYSIIFSSSFTIATDTNVRVVMILIMNLILYLSSTLFGGYNKAITTISSIGNIIGNIAILSIVISLHSDITSAENIFLAVVSLLIPTIHIVLSYLREKKTIYLCFELFIFIFKVFVVSRIFALTPDYTLLILSILSFIYVFIATSIFSKTSKLLYYTSPILSYFLSFILSLVILISTFFQPIVGLFVTETVLIISLLTILFVPVMKTNFRAIGIAATYSIFIFLITFRIVFPEAILDHYVYTCLGIGILLGILSLLSSRTAHKTIGLIIQPMSTVYLALTSLLAPFTVSLEVMSVVTGILTTYFIFKVILNKSLLTRIFANLSFISFSIFVVNHLMTLHIFDKDVSYSYLILVSSVILWIFIDFVASDRAIPEKLSFIFLFIIGIFVTQFNLLAVLTFLSVLLAISLYRAFNFKTSRYLVFSTILLNITIVYLLAYLKTNREHILVILTGINSILSLVRMTKNIDKRVTESISTTGLIINILLLVFLPIIWSSFPQKMEIFSLSYIFIFITMIMGEGKIMKKLSGIPILFALWNLTGIHNLSFQYNIVFITLYLLIIAYWNSRENKTTSAKALEITAYILQFSSLLLQSMLGYNDEEKIVVGVILIVLTSIFFLYGVNRQKKYVWIIACLYLLLELFIQLVFVIVLIPWWLYLTVIGLILISIAIYQMKK